VIRKLTRAGTDGGAEQHVHRAHEEQDARETTDEDGPGSSGTRFPRFCFSAKDPMSPAARYSESLVTAHGIDSM